jgi:drug/metabolite transporter (DMT)-like permease
MAALVICWGSTFAALKIAVAHIHPLWNTAFRLWIGLITLGVVLALQGQRLPSLRDPAWRFYAVTGAVGMAAPFALYAYSAQHVASAVNAMCNGASPIFTAALAHVFVAGDRMTPRRAGGVGLGFLGLAVLVAPRLSGGMTLEASGLIAALIGAALYAVANVLIKRTPAVSASVGAFMMVLWAGLFAGIVALAAAPPPAWPPLSSLIAVLALGVFPTALASIGYVYIIQRRGPLFVSMGIYVAPLWAVVIGVTFMGERPNWTAFAALALILAGVGLATLEPRKA